LVSMQLRSGYGLGLRGQDGQSKWTEEQVGHLAYAVRVVFARWTALTMAVENQWGGPDSQGKAQDLVRRVTEWLITTKEVYADELEDLLDAELMDSWHTQTEDESPREVATIITRIFYEALQGQSETLSKLASTATAAQKQIEQQLVQADPCGANSNGAELHPHVSEGSGRAKPEPDADGWTVVAKR